MQEEAFRRTQEMQRRANAIRIASENVPQVSMGNAGPSRTQSEPEASPQQEERRPPEIPHGPQITENVPDQANDLNAGKRHDRKIEPPVTETLSGRPSGGIFEVLFKDKEKTLILGLILLLMDEKTDNALLMALMYLLI